MSFKISTWVLPDYLKCFTKLAFLRDTPMCFTKKSTTKKFLVSPKVFLNQILSSGSKGTFINKTFKDQDLGI